MADPLPLLAGSGVEGIVNIQCQQLRGFCRFTGRQGKVLVKHFETRIRYGKNAVVKGFNMLKGATAIERNGQIGGHNSGL